MAIQQSRIDRIARTLKRLGFELGRTGRSFRIVDSAGKLAVGSQAAMSISEVEIWITNHIKPKRTGRTSA